MSGGHKWRSTARRCAVHCGGALRLYLVGCGAWLLGLATVPTQAEEAARVTPFVEEIVTTDDNVFRIANQVDAGAVIGYPARSDTYYTTSAGLSAEVPVSLQRFDATFTFNRSRYHRFHNLDFDGYDFRGSWLWQVARNLSGTVRLTDTYSLAPFAELLGVTRDRLKLREEFADGSWLFTPRWKLHAAADQLVQSNSDPAGLYNDVTVDSLEASLSRVSGAGGTLGVDARFESGHFPTAQPVAGQLIDNAYRQYSAGVVLDWGADSPSHVVARADQVSRRYHEVSPRDFDLTTAHVEYTWTPTGKLSVTAIAQRDISPYEYIHSSIVLVKGLVLRPVWHVSAKLDLSADFESLSRSYLSDPGLGLGVGIPRVDHVRSASALISCHPATSFTLQLSALHEQRSSKIAFGGYATDVVWLKARLAL
jgi:exopolysaccharide biosynthesis operon protein EpsL